MTPGPRLTASLVLSASLLVGRSPRSGVRGRLALARRVDARPVRRAGPRAPAAGPGSGPRTAGRARSRPPCGCSTARRRRRGGPRRTATGSISRTRVAGSRRTGRRTLAPPAPRFAISHAREGETPSRERTVTLRGHQAPHVLAPPRGRAPVTSRARTASHSARRSAATNGREHVGGRPFPDGLGEAAIVGAGDEHHDGGRIRQRAQARERSPALAARQAEIDQDQPRALSLRAREGRRCVRRALHVVAGPRPGPGRPGRTSRRHARRRGRARPPPLPSPGGRGRGRGRSGHGADRHLLEDDPRDGLVAFDRRFTDAVHHVHP